MTTLLRVVWWEKREIVYVQRPVCTAACYYREIYDSKDVCTDGNSINITYQYTAFVWQDVSRA